MRLQAAIAELRSTLADETSRADGEEAAKRHWMAEKEAQDVAHAEQRQAAAEAAEKTERQLKAEIEELKKQIERENENHRIQVAPMDSQIAELRKWLDEATEKNTALTKEKNRLEDDLSEMEKRLLAKSKAEADLRERKVPMLENEISKLDVIINKKDVEIEELKKRMAAIIDETGKRLAVLEKDLKSKNDFIEKQRHTIEGQEAQIAELRALLEDQTNETQTAQKACKQLEFDYEFLKKSNAALMKEIEELKKTLEVADLALAALEKKEAELQQKHAALQAEHAKCYKPQENCGIGMMLHDDEDDDGHHVVRMKQSVLGGSVWREQINNPSFRLKEGE